MRRFLHVPFLVFVTACASGAGVGGSGAPVTRDPAADPNILTAGEISRASGIETAWDAVNRLRQRYLRVSGGKTFGEVGGQPLVRIDDGGFTELAALRQVEVTRIREIRYYSAIDATQRFGGLNARPVIHVITSIIGPRR